MKFFGITYFNIPEKQSSLINIRTPKDLLLYPFINMDEIEYRNRKFTTRVLYRDEAERYYAGYLFKSKDTHVISLDKNKYQETDILNWEKLFFLIDTKSQIIVCEHKPSIITPTGLRKRIAVMTEKYYRNSGYTLKLEFNKDENSFWSLVGSTEKLYEMSFSLNAPNLFGLSKEATGFLRDVKESFNISSIGISFKNENGTLEYDKEQVEPLRDYIDSGGGKWILKLSDAKGKKRVHKSDTFYKTKNVDIEPDNNVSLEESVHLVIDKLKEAVRLLKDEAGT